MKILQTTKVNKIPAPRDYKSHFGQVSDFSLHSSFENMYPSLNIFLNRGDKEYHTEGRYQTPEEAYGIDNLILEQWPKYTERFKELYGYEMADPTLNVFKHDDYDGMMKLISSVIK